MSATKPTKRPARPKWLPPGIAHYGDLPLHRPPVHGCWLNIFASSKRGYAAALEIDFIHLPEPTVAGWALIREEVECQEGVRDYSGSPFCAGTYKSISFRTHERACVAAVRVAAVIVELYEAGLMLPYRASDPLAKLRLRAQERSKFYTDRLSFKYGSEEDRAKALPSLEQAVRTVSATRDPLRSQP